MLLAGALVIAGAAAAAVFWLNRVEERKEAAAKAQAGREERAAPVAAVALAPLPVKSPLVEREGKDEFGYPRSYVDRGSVRSLLAWKKYAELNGYIEQFQRDFLADFHNEYFVQDAVDAFGSAEAELGAELDAWVVATPGSFAPYLARAAHLASAGHAARGAKFRKDTDASNFEEMRRAFERAKGDLGRALELSPRLMPAFRYQMHLAYVGSTFPFREVANRAYEACSACYLVRTTEQAALEPRWGGSYRQMEAAARSAPVAENPRLRLLQDFAALDQKAQGSDAQHGIAEVEPGQVSSAKRCVEGKRTKPGVPPEDVVDPRSQIGVAEPVPQVSQSGREPHGVLPPGRVDMVQARERAAEQSSRNRHREIREKQVAPLPAEGAGLPTEARVLQHEAPDSRDRPGVAEPASEDDE